MIRLGCGVVGATGRPYRDMGVAQTRPYAEPWNVNILA